MEYEEKLQYKSRPQVLEELMKMDLDTAPIKEIKDKMGKLGISYVGLIERSELVDKLLENFPELQMKMASKQGGATSLR